MVRRLLTAAVLFGLCLFGGCEVNQGDLDGVVIEPEEVVESDDPADVTEAEDVQEADTHCEDVEAEPVEPSHDPTALTGCAWVTGDWQLVDCQGQAIPLSLFTQGCIVQVVSASPVFANATGSAAGPALSLFLPTTGTTCHGYFDGVSLLGACDVSGGTCAFAAEKP